VPIDYVDGIAGATVTAGQPVYRDGSDSGKLKPADANASAAASAAIGIAMHGALSGQNLRVCVGGEINMGAILTAGIIYVVGATAGEINPAGDLTSGWYTNILGWARTTSIFRVKPINTGTVLA
jgi:hypothetical protein